MKEKQKQATALDATDIFALFNRLDAKLEKLLSPTDGQGERSFMSLKTAAFYSDLSQKTLRRFIADGSLTAYRPAKGKVLLKRKELDALINKSTKQVRSGRGIKH